MARSFGAGEAKLLLQQLENLRENLRESQRVAGQQKQAVLAAVEKYAIEEALQILASAPVEEINREREGFRTQLLRESGYETLADVWTAEREQLVAIHGIGEEMADRLKSRAAQIARLAGDAVRIRLSADRKDLRSTELVLSTAIYRESEEVLRILRRLSDYEPQRVAAAEEALRPRLHALGWFFASRAKKEAAERAFRELEGLVDGSFGDTARKAFTELERIEATAPREAWAAFERDPIPTYRVLEELAPGRLGGDGVCGLPEELARAIRGEEYSLEGLRCTLRRYQEWGLRYILHQRRVLLGDEMGLGKTVQAIAAMTALQNAGERHFLVVCPASVMANWCKEIPRHSRLRVTQIYGPGRLGQLNSWLRSGGVAVTTYENTAYLRLDPGFAYSMLTVDEAHYIKNPAAQRTQNVRRLAAHADRLLFMTGTALENRVEEMISLIEILQPRVADQIRSLSFMATAPQFRERVAEVYYRRKREDVLTELPELVESREWCTLGAEERQVYETAVLAKDYAAARRVSWNAPLLRQSCKARRLLELVEEAAEEGRKVLIFSFFLETGRRVRELLGDRCLEPINGSVPPGLRQAIVEQFDAAPPGSVLACQIQSGGTGLNIQSASVVILCEPQFKPSTENQAISRAYRMGQARSVLVYRLLCDDTVDERILELLENKQALFDAFADRSEAAELDAALDEKSFGEIMEEERRSILERRGELT